MYRLAKRNVIINFVGILAATLCCYIFSGNLQSVTNQDNKYCTYCALEISNKRDRARRKKMFALERGCRLWLQINFRIIPLDRRLGGAVHTSFSRYCLSWTWAILDALVKLRTVINCWGSHINKYINIKSLQWFNVLIYVCLGFWIHTLVQRQQTVSGKYSHGNMTVEVIMSTLSYPTRNNILSSVYRDVYDLKCWLWSLAWDNLDIVYR